MIPEVRIRGERVPLPVVNCAVMSRPWASFGTAFLLTLALTLASAAARAEEGGAAQPPSFDALVAQAMEHYQARRYEEALVLFEQAYAIDPEPELVYNIARSHERLLHREQAVDAYERFLQMPGTTGELRTRALENLTALRQEIAALETARRAEALARRTPVEPETPTPDPRTEPPPQRPDERPAPRPGMSALGVAGWALFGTGGGIALAGVVCWGLALSSNGSFQDAGTGVERLGLRDDVTQRSLAGDVLFFTGAAALAAGVALVAVDSVRRRRASTASLREREHDAALAVAPSLGPGLLGLGLSGAF
jgi:tetratricopeptide (TPR) repeat protein